MQMAMTFPRSEPNIAAYYTVNNELYSMPFNSSTPILYYNKDMFEKQGSPRFRQAWKEFLPSVMI